MRIYIPGFGNENDVIYEKYLKNKGEIIQENFRIFGELKFTRPIEYTVKKTTESIFKCLKSKGINNEIIGHSQGGLVTILSVINNPEILKNISKIELITPVTSYEEGYNFHKGKENGYIIEKKGIKVRKEYIESLKNNSKTDILFDFLEFLNKEKWDGKINIILSKDDDIIEFKKFKKNLKGIKKLEYIFKNITIKVNRKGGHYLGFK